MNPSYHTPSYFGRPETFVPRKQADPTRLYGEAKTHGWDLVYTKRYSAINREIAAGDLTPKHFKSSAIAGIPY